MSTKPHVSFLTSDVSAGARGNGQAVRGPLVIVGMHRSGTSFVASLLRSAGVDMGSRLMPATRSNERGHFENMDFVEFHMRWLTLTGNDDSGWTALQPLTLSDDASAEARDVIDANAHADAWGWKDPRTTLFLDFWSNLLPDATYLYVYREPSEVIDSLFRRGDESIQLSPDLAAAAYLAHNEMMLQHAREHRNQGIITNVGAVASDPERFLAMVAQKFGRSLDLHVPSTFEGELMRTIAPDAPRAIALRQLLPEIDRLYDALEHEADMPLPRNEAKHPSTGKAKNAFFTGWQQEHERSAELQTALEHRDAEVASLRDSVKTLEESNTLRGMHLEEAERLLTSERADATKQIEAQIVATRAESEQMAVLIATVQSSSFWKIKRGINRILRYFVPR